MFGSVTTKAIVLVALYALTAGLLASLLTPPQPTAFPSALRIILITFAAITLTRYSVYLVLGLRYSRLLTLAQTSKLNHNPDFRPLVSIIIPAWNEEVGLVATVQSVLQSSYQNLEIIVINDGSTDCSDERMRAFLAACATDPSKVKHVPIIYHYQPNGGKSRALNTGLILARGDIIITIDADCRVDKNTIAHFVPCFADPSVMAAVGTVKIGNTSTIWGLIQRLEYIVGFYFKRAESLLQGIHIIGGAAGAFRRQVFEQLGPFRTDHLTEDMELTLRIQKAGMKIVYSSQAVVTTEGASTLWSLMQQRLRWKRGRLSALHEHRQLFFSFDQRHQRILSWVILPLIILGEMSLLLELPFVISLVIYGWFSGDFTPFLASAAVITCFTSIQIFVTERSHHRLRLFALTPISWWLLAVVNYIEASALARSLWMISRHRVVRWQQWQRVGLETSLK